MVSGRPRPWAAIFLAVSPAMVFYSRYFIHEMLLVFFTLLTLAAGWRYAKKRSVFLVRADGRGLGLMFATKETFVLTLARWLRNCNHPHLESLAGCQICRARWKCHPKIK